MKHPAILLPLAGVALFLAGTTVNLTAPEPAVECSMPAMGACGGLQPETEAIIRDATSAGLDNQRAFELLNELIQVRAGAQVALKQVQDCEARWHADVLSGR